MEKEFPYVTKLDIRFDHLERFDVNEMVKACTDHRAESQPGRNDPQRGHAPSEGSPKGGYSNGGDQHDHADGRLS